MLSLIETGKFSLGEMGRVIAGQVKLELVGIAARAGVWALFELAAGLASAAWGNAPGAALHFASAKTYGAVAGVALAGAAGMHGLFGGTTSRPAAGTVGGEPVRTTSTALAPTTSEPTRPTQNIYLTIHTLTGALDGKAQEAIMEAINSAGDRNIKLNANVIAAGA